METLILNRKQWNLSWTECVEIKTSVHVVIKFILKEVAILSGTSVSNMQLGTGSKRSLICLNLFLTVSLGHRTCSGLRFMLTWLFQYDAHEKSSKALYN